MLFPEEDAPLLKAWVVKRIENTSDADAEVLAEYIIALLKHDGDRKSIRALCEQEIPDFLTEDSKTFLDDVFQAIAYKSYLPGAPPPPKVAAPNLAQQPAIEADPFQGLQPPTGPRKRGYHDLDAPGGQEQHSNGPRPMKNPRRMGNGPMRPNADNGRIADSSLSGSAAPFEPQNPMPMEAFMAMGMPMPGGLQPLPSPVSSRGGRSKRRGRCRDFDNKGYCSRGGTCPYDHGNGNESAYASPMPYQNGEYNPGDPILAFQAMQEYMNSLPFNMDASRGRGNRRGGRGKKGGSRAAFSADGPVFDRTKSTIVVENIPEENFSEEEVRNFFSQFGNIVEVSMQPYKHLAIVKFDKWGSANAAYRSPKVIFDNRFVKVFWYKEDAEPAKAAGTNDAKSGQEPLDADMADAEPDMDPEEFKRRQEEAQKQFQEREAKRLELEKQRQELEQKQRELMDKHREETERLKLKLAQKNGEDGDTPAPTTGAEALRAKLADLEREAKILGIDPDAADTASAGSFPARGRGSRGGRGGFPSRGRGWRGGRAGFGGVDGRHAAYAQYSLDNRPKKLAITGVDFSIPEKDEGLRHFLLNLGEFESVEPSSTTTYVSFQDRKTAELLYNTLNGKKLPGVEGKLDIQWVSGGTSFKPPAPSTSSNAKGNGSNEEGDSMAGMDNEGQSRSTDQRPQEQPEQVEMEYERPEDDDDAY